MTVSSIECWVNTQYLAAGCKHKAKNRLKSVWYVDFFECFVPVWQINKIKLTEKNNRPEFPFFFPAWRTLPGVYVTFVLWKMKTNKIHISWRGCRNFQQSFSHGRQLNLVPYEREVAVAGEAGGMGGSSGLTSASEQSRCECSSEAVHTCRAAACEGDSRGWRVQLRRTWQCESEVICCGSVTGNTVSAEGNSLDAFLSCLF